MPESVPLESVTDDPGGDGDARGFDVFLSHNSRDKRFVERIAERLKRTRLEPWFDGWQLVPGARWQRGLEAGLLSSRACAVFISPASLGDWESEELGLALDRAAKDSEFRLFLVLLPGLPEPFDSTALPQFLLLRTWVDYRGGLDDERAFHRLISAVNGVPPGPSVPLEESTDVCPYRGLEVFEEEHAGFFFGREADVQRLVEKLKEARFLAVLGASGSGKSSLVRAGLLPALRGSAAVDEAGWEIVTMRPGGHPLEALAAQLVRLTSGGAMQQTLDGLAGDPRTLHLAGTFALSERPPSTRLLLFVDQFEEVFTLCRDEGERTGFFANLLYAAKVPDGGTVVLPTIRADFYHRCGAYPELAQLLAAGQYLVSPLQPEGLRQAIEEPARRVGLAFEPGLVATILDDVAAQPGALPLLEHALLELWARRAGGMLTLAGYQESGGVQGAIAKRAEDVFASLDPTQQELARRTFLRLTQPGEGTEDTRRRASLSELESREADVAPVLGELVTARLVVTSRDETSGGEVIEVSHEALIRGWPRLRAWVDEDRTGLRIHRRLTEAAGEWERVDRDPSALYRGVRLSEAVEWRAGNEEALDDLERSFLTASSELRMNELRAARRRKYFALGSLVAALSIVSAVAIFALIQRQSAIDQRDVARSDELAARAGAQLAIDPDRSLRLAMDAAAFAKTDQAQNALRQALLTAPLLHAVLGRQDSAIRSAAFSPNGTRVVTIDNSGFSVDGERILRDLDHEPVRVWASDGTTVAVLKGFDTPARAAAFSPDGAWVVTASTDQAGDVRVWDASSGKQLVRLPGASYVDALTFSPDGRFLMAQSFGQARIWPTASWKRIRIPYSENAAFSSDSKRVLGLDSDSVRAWRARDGKLMFVQRLHDGYTPTAFSPDGRFFVTTRKRTKNVAQLWRFGDKAPLAILDGHHGEITSVAFSLDRKFVVTTSRDKTARVWRLAQPHLVAVLRGHERAVTSVVFNRSGTVAVTTSDDGTARVWSCRNWQPLAILRFPHRTILNASPSADAKLVVTTDGGSARVWQLGQNVTRLTSWRAHHGAIRSVAFSGDGKRLLTAGADGAARIWDPTTHRQIRELKLHSQLISASFSPDGETALTAERNGSINIWNTRNNETVPLAPHSTDRLWNANFDNDGRHVVAASDGEARIWDVQTLQRVNTLPSLSLRFRWAAFSPDGRTIATAQSPGLAALWPWATLQRFDLGTTEGIEAFQQAHGTTPDGIIGPRTAAELHRRLLLTGIDTSDSGIGYIAFSPDGTRVVTAGADGLARVWDAASAHVTATLRGPPDAAVTEATFSPNGAFLATAARDGTARIWTATGQNVATIGGAAEPISSLTFSTDGKDLVAGGANGNITIYACSLCGSINDLEALAEPRLPN